MDRRLLAAFAAVATFLPLPSALAFDPALELDNFSKTTERDRYVVLTPEFQQRLNQQLIDDPQRSLAIRQEELAAGADMRLFETNVCFSRNRECAGDVRFYEWEETGFGKTEEVLFGARDGATISAKVWATKEGPAKRPGIVITTGSVQAPETLYWGYAATLAKHGYVVLTYDVQGQGQSDTFGEGDDRLEGVPSQAGQPFYDGTEDALDFLLSSPGSPYDPRPSCGNANDGVGTDHSPKHERRVEARAEQRATTRSGSSSTRIGSASPATRSERAPSPTSASSTRGSTRSSLGTTSAPPRPAGASGPPSAPPAPRRARPSCRSPSPRSGSPTTTG